MLVQNLPVNSEYAQPHQDRQDAGVIWSLATSWACSPVAITLTLHFPAALVNCFSDTPGSFPPQGLSMCCTAQLLVPISSSHRLLIHKCLFKCHLLREAYPVTPSGMVMCPPLDCLVSPTRMSTPGGLELCFVYSSISKP